MNLINLNSAYFIILLTFILTACGGGGGGGDGPVSDPDPRGCFNYGGAGSWPQNAGDWKSPGAPTGQLHDWVYLDIKVNENGTFSGNYQSYVVSGSYCCIMGVEIPIYQPDGREFCITGVVDYNKRSGVAWFDGPGETSFDVVVHNDKSMNFVFPSSFAYKATTIKKADEPNL